MKIPLLASHPFPLQDPVGNWVLTTYIYPYFHNYSEIVNLFQYCWNQNYNQNVQTLATNSRSLLGGNSTFRGVIVADATALAACIGEEQYQQLELSQLLVWSHVQNNNDRCKSQLRHGLLGFILHLLCGWMSHLKGNLRMLLNHQIRTELWGNFNQSGNLPNC